MTEAEWEVCDDAPAMLRSLHGRASDRKLRLLACASSRRLWSQLADDRARRAVEALERIADGEGPLPYAALARSMAAVKSPTIGTVYLQPSPDYPPYVSPGSLVSDSTVVCLIEVMNVFNEVWPDSSGVIVEVCVEDGLYVGYNSPLFRFIPAVRGQGAADGSGHLAPLVRDIFPPPGWRDLSTTCVTADVASLANAAYARGVRHTGELDPLRLAVLADALEEAGTGEEIVAHLRDSGPHVRGCWAVDLCLGRS